MKYDANIKFSLNTLFSDYVSLFKLFEVTRGKVKNNTEKNKTHTNIKVLENKRNIFVCSCKLFFSFLFVVVPK